MVRAALDAWAGTTNLTVACISTAAAMRCAFLRRNRSARATANQLVASARNHLPPIAVLYVAPSSELTQEADAPLASSHGEHVPNNGLATVIYVCQVSAVHPLGS